MNGVLYVAHFRGNAYQTVMEGMEPNGRYRVDVPQGPVGQRHNYRGRGRGRDHGRLFGRGRRYFRGRGRGGQVNTGDYVEDGIGHSEFEGSHPHRGRSNRGHGRGRGRRRGHHEDSRLDSSIPYHRRTRARGIRRQSFNFVVGPSHAESLSWIQTLKGLSSDDLVDAVKDDLKQFQTFINSDCEVDLKEMSTVISILVQLSRCSEDKKEAANQILAECISDRCKQFHLQLLRSVQQVAYKQDRHTVNYVLLLVNLCCALLDQFHYTAMSVLPVMDIQREVQVLISGNPSEVKLETAEKELSVRIDQIASSGSDLGQAEGKPIRRHSQDEEEEMYSFSTTSILPEPDELRSREVPKLTPNIIEGKYKSWDHYYNTQFHLLREDFVAPLRQGICDYMMGLRGRDLQDVRVYNGIRIIEPKFDRQGVSYRIQFETDRLKYVKWDRTKRLIYGSLVCLSSDGFTSQIVFASISNRDPEALKKGFVDIKPEGDSAFLPWNAQQEYTMVESSAYYEAYRHILSSLQNAEVDTMPFKQYLVDVDCEEVGQPTYLNRRGIPSVYDLSSSLNCASTSVVLTDNDSWPEASSTQLDSSQMKAMKMALTQDVAVIQGPPGTGKTYMGIKIVETLVQNRSSWDPSLSSPILVVCFTNHALDQFLNGIKQVRIMERSWLRDHLRPQRIRIARVGGRADESMKEYALKNLRRGIIPEEEFQALRSYREDLDEERLELSMQIGMLNHNYSDILSVQQLASVLSVAHHQQLWNACEPSPIDPPNLHLLLWLGLHELNVPDPQISSEGRNASNESLKDGNADDAMPHDNGQKGKSVVRQDYEETDDSPGEDLSVARQANIENPYSEVSTQLVAVHDTDVKLEGRPDISVSAAEMTMTDDEQIVDVQDELELERDLQRLYFGGEEVQSDSWHEHSHRRASPTVTYGDNVSDIPDGEELIAVEDEVALEQDSRMIDYGNEDDESQYQLSNESDCIRLNPVCMEPSQYERTSRPVKDYKKKKDKLVHCVPLTEAQAAKITDIYNLPQRVRWSLYRFWLERLKTRDISWQFVHFNNLCKRYRDMDQEQDSYALERVHVIGMTTTGAAKYQHILHMVKPKIVIVEEAAEVLESHIVSCLTASTQHLILIGDHQQLRPKPNVYELAKTYNLDISLFERLVRNDFPRVTLEIQHRMRPEIAELVHPLIYPVLKNHESVCGYGNIKGISGNMFFIDHCELEQPNDELRSHSNIHEAKFLAALCRYLIRQEYRPEQITVLCAYTGQLFEVRKHMPRKEFDGVKVRTLDNYQGEENDIVLLTLVRSNTAKKIGFLRAEHRVCVALSRAKVGFYCIGNFQLLRKEGEIWENLVPILEQKQVIGPALTLRCENHPDTATEIRAAEDFTKVPEGGCSLDCGVRLDCGHACRLKCHSYDREHERYQCKMICPHTCGAGHGCLYQCHHPEPCSPCKVQVEKVIPSCGHSQTMHCHKDPGDIDILCRTVVVVTCERGHDVRKKCHKRNDPCKESVITTLLCGHSQAIKCYEDAAQVACKSHCELRLQCGHQCPRMCGEMCTTVCRERVEKVGLCGHTLNVMCHQDVLFVVCPQACSKTLRCGHKCPRTCGEPCESRCQVKVEVKLDCGHSYMKTCSLTSDVRCCEAVKKELLCGHTAVMPCAQDHTHFVCNETIMYKLPCGHMKKLMCSEKDSYQCTERVKVKQPCGHSVQTKCAERGKAIVCAYPCQWVLACGHPCLGTCGKCFMGRLHVQCSQKVKLILPCGHFSQMRCNEQYGNYHCKAKCEFSCHHRVCQQGKVPCDGVICPSLSCSQPCSWSCPHVRCENACKELCGVPACDQPCPKPLRCKHPCEGLCGERCPAICRQCSKRRKKKSKSQAQMGHPVTKDESCRFIQLKCNHIFEVPHLDRYMRGTAVSGDKKVSIKVCLKCRRPIYGIHRYHDLTKKTMKLLHSIENERRHLQLELQPPAIPHFLSPARMNWIKQLAHNPNEASSLSSSKHLPLPEPTHGVVVGNVFGAQQCDIMSHVIGYMNVILNDLIMDSEPVILKHVGSDLLTALLTSFYHLNVFQWPGTPQGVHDWVKETIRLQLLICLLICKLQAISGRTDLPLPVLNQLQKTLCEPPRVKGAAAGGGALSLQALQQVQDKLFDISPGHNMTPIADIKLPRFSSTEWYECQRGHLYCKFTKSELKIDIFRHLEDSCPVCSNVQLEHYCTISPK